MGNPIRLAVTLNRAMLCLKRGLQPDLVSVSLGSFRNLNNVYFFQAIISTRHLGDLRMVSLAPPVPPETDQGDQRE